jgi:hypothetical protein
MLRRTSKHCLVVILLGIGCLAWSSAAEAQEAKEQQQQLQLAPIIVVAPEGQGDYENINEALENAKPGTRIIVMPGDYEETLSLKRRIEILLPVKSTKKAAKKVEELSCEKLTSNIDGDDDVDPSIKEIVIHFPEAMKTAGFSLDKVDADEYGEFPGLLGDKPTFFRDDKTLVIQVRLKSNTKYGFGLNCEENKVFQTIKGVPLEGVIYYFKTGDYPPDKLDFMTLTMEFMKKPTREYYLALQKSIITDENFSTNTKIIGDALELYEQEKYDEAQKKLKETTPSLFLSPRANVLSAKIAEKQGDKKGAEFSFNFANKCLQGILSTGDGSEKSPYIVTLVEDEYDLLRMHFDKEVDTQFFRQEKGKAYDIIKCTDGTTLWFDITIPHSKGHN